MLNNFFLIAVTLCAMSLIAGSASAKELTAIGVTLGSLGNPYFTAIAKGVTDRAKQNNPNVKVTVVASNYDLNKQFHSSTTSLPQRST